MTVVAVSHDLGIFDAYIPIDQESSREVSYLMQHILENEKMEFNETLLTALNIGIHENNPGSGCCVCSMHDSLIA